MTAGPKFTSTTRAETPKLSSVFSMTEALRFMSPRSAFCPPEDDKSDMGGYSQTLLTPGTLVTRLVPNVVVIPEDALIVPGFAACGMAVLF